MKQMNQVEVTTIDFLQKLEMPTHLLGYRYIKTAVQKTIDDPTIIQRMTTDLYPTIAKEYETKANRVERGIRHAISQVNEDALRAVLKIRTDRVSNSYFIASLAETVTMQLSMEGPIQDLTA
jgi:two-component system response regulator (stage 0 sporulation protein A)